MPSQLAEPCYRCKDVLTKWAKLMGTDPKPFIELVQAHPVEPNKTWELKSPVNKSTVLMASYRCPRCGKTWRRARK